MVLVVMESPPFNAADYTPRPVADVDTRPTQAHNPPAGGPDNGRLKVWQVIQDIEGRAALARQHGPQDIFTRAALLCVKVGSTALLILLPVQVVTTAVGGCLIALTLGLFAILLSLIWLPFLGLLLGSSWLWLKVPLLRPILLVPGVLIALIAHAYVMLAPEPERDAKWAKLTLAGEWPLSWLISFPPDEWYSDASELDLSDREYGAVAPLMENEADAPNGLEVWAYTKFGRKGHILIDGTDNLALCGRECERRTGEDYFEPCNTCWDRRVGNRRYWARRLRKSIDEKHSGTVITLFGANGGIGKTIMATNLAVALAQSGQRVALVDLHLRFGDVALLMEVPNEPNIADLVGAERKVTEESLERCLYRHETGVSVLPCPFPLAEWQRVRAHVGCIETVVTLLAQTYDYVVLDTGLPFDHVMALALKLASTVLFVTPLDQTSLDDSHRVLGMLRLWHFPQDRIKLIANATSEHPSKEPHDIALVLGREVFTSVPYDRNISMATEPGTPLVASHPESRAAQSILGLGKRVALGRRKGMSDQSEDKKGLDREADEQRSSSNRRHTR